MNRSMKIILSVALAAASLGACVTPDDSTADIDPCVLDVECNPWLPYSDPSAPLLPLCAVEDASYGPLPCRWEAGIEGNGQGLSFTVFALHTNGQGRYYVYDDGTKAIEP